MRGHPTSPVHRPPALTCLSALALRHPLHSPFLPALFYPPLAAMGAMGAMGAAKGASISLTEPSH